MKSVVLYGHGGAANHGCEAIVRGTCKINGKQKIVLFSLDIHQDSCYEITGICNVEKAGKTLKKYSMDHFLLKFKSLLKNNCGYYTEYFYRKLLKNIQTDSVCLSIGGDNYCYTNSPQEFAYLNKRIASKYCKTVLWGCSITPDLLEHSEIVDDLNRYSLITPRESITYDALIKAGVNKNTKLFPDPAFVLDTVTLEAPEGFIEHNTIGINVSPLIIECEANLGVTMQNYIALIQHIIDTTKMQIALIPHVVNPINDDRDPLGELYNVFSHTGRVVMIEDHNCMELKGFIVRCRMFIGARTHATIAAYSSCVPTLVVGYSVKAKGIAKDIFGTYENYVIPVQTLANKDDLIHAFEWLKNHEKEINIHLKEFMPAYIEKAYEAGKEVEKLIENQG